MRREFEARRAEFFGMVAEQMSEDILGRACFAAGAGGSRQRPTTPDEALQVTTMWGVTRDVLVAALPNLGLSLQGSVRGAHGSDTLAARQQALIDAMTPDGQRAYREAIAALRREPFWANYLDTTTVFIFPDLSGANRYAGYTQRGTERDPDGNETRAFIIHISKDALEAGNLDSVVANLVHELSHTLDVGATIRPALDSFLDELAGLLADHPDVQALRQGAADAAEARTTHVRRISQILCEHTGYGEAEVFAHLQQLTHQPAVDVSGQQVSGSRYILGTIEGHIRQLMSIGINPRALDNLLDALGRRAAILYDRRIEAAPAGSTQRQRLQREKEIAELTLRLARDLAREEPVQPKREQGAQAGEERELERAPADYAARILEMAGLDNATWFSSFTSITFLGQSVSDIHTDLATHPKAVETKFAESHGGPSKDPAVAGAALGLNQAIGGGRHAPTGTAFSMHLFGLAIDVNYQSNPWVGSSANKVFERAGWLAAGKKLQYKDGMTYDDLKALDEALETYFSYIDNAAALSAQLAAIADDANPWKGKRATGARSSPLSAHTRRRSWKRRRRSSCEPRTSLE